MAEESSAQGGDYSVINENGIFKFNDVNLEKERSDLTSKKAHQNHLMRLFKNLLPKVPEYYQALLNIYENQEPIQDPDQDPCEDLILADFLADLKGKKLLEDIYTLRDYNSQISDKVPQGIPDDFPNAELFSNKRDYESCKEENEKLIQGIKSIKGNEIQDTIFKQLTLDTIDKFGSNPYKDGTIAAQSMDFVKADVTLFWSVCGEGMFGRDNDVNYADLIANAIDAESMKQVREDLGVNRIAAASSTKDELNAVSAFMALNAEGTVYIAAGSECPLGQYLTEVELPILLRNSNVTSIELIDTSKPHFLENLKGIAESCKTQEGFALEKFQNNAKKLINEFGVKRGIFNRTGKNITKENVEAEKCDVINHINPNQQNIEKLRKIEKDLDKEIMFDNQYGSLKSDIDKLKKQIDSLKCDLERLNTEKNNLMDVKGKNEVNRFVDTSSGKYKVINDSKRAANQLKEVNKKLNNIMPEIENKERDKNLLQKDLDKRNLEMRKHQDMRNMQKPLDYIEAFNAFEAQIKGKEVLAEGESGPLSTLNNIKERIEEMENHQGIKKPLSYLKAFKDQRREEKALAEKKSGPLSTLNNTIKKARKQSSQQKQPLTK